MYQLNFGEYTIYDPRLEELCVRSAKVKLAVDEAGSMTFALDHDHPYIDQLTRLKGRLELLSDGVPVFRGRLLSDMQEFDLSREFEAEGQLACLNDSLVAPFEFPSDFESDSGYKAAAASGNVVEWWLSYLLGNHNSQVTTEQQIKLGTVTVKDANNYIARSSEDYATTWETLTGKLTGSSLGGHFLVRYESDGTYLDYLADYPLSNTQSIEYAENLMDLSDEIDASELYTAILPVGKDGLTIKSLSDGALTSDLVKDGAVIYSKAAVEKYGRITSIQTWDDVTLATNLRDKAKALLAQSGVLPSRTISVSAVDLHWTDEDVAQLRVGRYTPIVSAPHDLDARYVLSELELNILDPGSSQVTLGATIQTSTDRNQSAISGLQDKIDKVESKQGIKEVDVEYYLSDSATERTGGEWSTTAPTWTEGKYIWSRTKTVSAKGSVTYSDPVCITGAKGDPGAQGNPGEQGIGVSAIVAQYYLSESETEQTGGEWSTDQPEWQDEHYIWTRSQVTWTDGSITYTDPVLAKALNYAGSTAAGASSLAQITSDRVTTIEATCDEIKQTAEETVQTVTDLSTRVTTAESTITQTANQLEIRISQTEQDITNVNGDLQSRFTELEKYIRFTTDGLELGETGNNINLLLDNDRISFRDAGLEVAYISDKQLYITDAEIVNSLRIGKFAWVPRNSGNLSLVKVGD